MRNKLNELLFSTAQRRLFHSRYRSDNSTVNEIYELMADMDLDDLWMLTQM